MLGEKLSGNISNFINDVHETSDYLASLPYGQFDPWLKFSGAVSNALGQSSAQSYSHTLDDFNYYNGTIDQSLADKIRAFSYRLSNGVSSTAKDARDAALDLLNSKQTNDTSDPQYYSVPTSPVAPVYQDAPLAEIYGMNSETAYQEALSNTAMQRYVRDLKAAGLNPVLGLKSGGSDSFSGSALSAYAGSGSGSGSGSAFKDNAAGIGKLLGAVASLVGSVVGNSITTKYGRYGALEASSARSVGNSASSVLSALGSLVERW